MCRPTAGLSSTLVPRHFPPRAVFARGSGAVAISRPPRGKSQQESSRYYCPGVIVTLISSNTITRTRTAADRETTMIARELGELVASSAPSPCLLPTQTKRLAPVRIKKPTCFYMIDLDATLGGCELRVSCDYQCRHPGLKRDRIPDRLGSRDARERSAAVSTPTCQALMPAPSPLRA